MKTSTWVYTVALVLAAGAIVFYNSIGDGWHFPGAFCLGLSVGVARISGELKAEEKALGR